tara:strand:+ start:4307 stop:4603 length:297 start_codon:yes stop_codon:yes gene_type:complete
MSDTNTNTTTTDDSVNESLTENPMLSMVVEKDSALKEYLVEYVGTKLDQEDVTVHMIAEVMASEFPEFLFSLAEENFLRGYKVGLNDAELLERTTSAE